jgi:hypothetical protein
VVIPSENPSTSADKIGSFFIQLVFVRHNHKATKSRYFAESSKHRKKDELTLFIGKSLANNHLF